MSMTDEELSMMCRGPELEEKRRRLHRLMGEQGLDALVIARNENIAWATAGSVDVRVGVLREVGAASLLLTREGGAFYLTTNNEAARLADEEFAGLGYEPVVLPWYANDVQASIAKIAGAGRVAGDLPMGANEPIPLQKLRWELTDHEVERYRWLGQHVAEVGSAVLRSLQPGMNERTLQAMVAERLIARGVTPSVYLTAVDGRALDYCHAVPRAGVLKHLGMVGFCARRWGLSVSMTRFVHFGAMPEELEERFAVVAQVNARLMAATREGATSDGLFAVAAQAYADLGWAGQERTHHQGGATGYVERDWVARPGGDEKVGACQAFAWNPNLRGAKVEDTLIARVGEVEVLTATPGLPVIRTEWAGSEYRSAGVLVG
jgi:antitoxin VapB